MGRRDLVVEGRIHKVYFYALALMMIVQGIAMYASRVNPAWWKGITEAILRG